MQGPEEVAEGPAVGGDLTLDGFAAIPGSDYIPAFENAVPSEACPQLDDLHPKHMPSSPHCPQPMLYAPVRPNAHDAHVCARLSGGAADSFASFVPPVARQHVLMVQNIGGQAVADQDECASICLADPACNAASFYLDPTPYGGNNCWTKTLSIPCELPSDASSDPNAVFLLQETECTPHLSIRHGYSNRPRSAL